MMAKMHGKPSRLPRNVPLQAVGLLCAAVLTLAPGCDDDAPTRRGNLRFHDNNADVYLSSVSATLNDLPRTLDLNLLPAQPILTASTSADGNEVRAICTRNPRMEGGPINYLRVVDENANFLSLGVEEGDVVRYYVNLDLDAAERNIEQRTAIEPKVRRLDALDPENALIIEGYLEEPVLMPQRIEIWRVSDKRTDAIRSALNRYVDRFLPRAGWEPSPDLASLRQIVERANQWLRNEDDEEGRGSWDVNPLLASVPSELRESPRLAPIIAEDELRNGMFADWEGRLLEQAVWCRDISQWARGDALADVDAAAALFDWTIRNVQLNDADAVPMVFHPWQALAYGRGTGEHRAWVFVELSRQLGIDAVVLQAAATEDGPPAPLLVAALIEEQLYLFDPQLGLAIPGRDGAVATLDEVVENPELLRQLDVNDELTYPLDAEQLDEVAALVVASPLQLARRSARLEAALEGEDFVKLSADSSGLVERLAELPHVGEVRLWPRPFQAIIDEFSTLEPVRLAARREFEPFAQCPVLWQARVLHFQGNKDVRADERDDPLAEPREGHLEALRHYQDDTVRPSEDMLATLERTKRVYYTASKAAASYWLGLLSYDVGNYDVAVSWLSDRTLKRDPQQKWASGARYNLARTYEALEQPDEAIELLEATPEGVPERYGNLLRAKWLADAAANDDSADGENVSEN